MSVQHVKCDQSTQNRQARQFSQQHASNAKRITAQIPDAQENADARAPHSHAPELRPKGAHTNTSVATAREAKRRMRKHSGKPQPPMTAMSSHTTFQYKGASSSLLPRQVACKERYGRQTHSKHGQHRFEVRGSPQHHR